MNRENEAPELVMGEAGGSYVELVCGCSEWEGLRCARWHIWDVTLEPTYYLLLWIVVKSVALGFFVMQKIGKTLFLL